MKNTNQKSRSRQLLVAGTLLVSSFAVGGLPGFALADPPAGGPPAGAPASAAPGPARSAMPRAGRGVDGLISHLHAELKITPAQEGQFQKLADVMRENAQTMSALARKRSEGAATMSAVDDLKSYAEISRAHADGAERMVPAFQALYDTMSDDQKKIADQEFRDHYATHHRHRHGA